MFNAKLKSPTTQVSGGRGGNLVQKRDFCVPLTAGAYTARMFIEKYLILILRSPLAMCEKVKSIILPSEKVLITEREWWKWERIANLPFGSKYISVFQTYLAMLAISSTFECTWSVVSLEVFLYISWRMITSALKECSRRRTCLALTLSARPLTFQDITLTIERRCHSRSRPKLRKRFLFQLLLSAERWIPVRLCIAEPD